ncbi:cupin domain-containing protein [Spiractinospora alimapuensis]|uniref:cupin domain-containing protein n=1 Tax=Spiractinospora alimapuensis TaxID=2820884 RepID=UPI001F30CA95|nr:cupin domain-containing protein [Spiractinospora alimapuensis]QVQ50835.1 cupin domain-containing protein [Spiractinospora alimapuensis]
MSGDRGTGFPGGTGVSRLRVYDWLAEDGKAGGSPHLHTVSSEGYVVVRGTGTLETLSGNGYREVPLAAGTLLWFTPGTVHRLVNHSGDLELVVVMQNAGLPESGDAILTFPPEVLDDEDAYLQSTVIPAATEFPDAGSAQRGREEAARVRRDLAVRGYLRLRDDVLKVGPSALAPLHTAAARLVRESAGGWLHHWERGPHHQAETTRHHVADLTAGRAPHLADSAVYLADPVPGVRHGMCGLLDVWDLDGAHVT